MRYKKIFVLVGCLLSCAASIAQQYPFVQYTPKDGLVNSRVRKIYQDAKGRMYFLTYGGLSVYNGARFKNFTTANGLSFNLVNDVIEAGPDSLLIAVNVNQLHKLVNGKVSAVKTSDGFCPVINQFLKSSDGNIYACADDGLFCFRNNRFERLPAPRKDKPTEGPYFGSFVEWNNYFILTTNELRDYTGLFLYDKKTKRVTDAMEDVHINCIAKDEHNRVWVSLPNRTLLLDSVLLSKQKLGLVSPASPFEPLANLSAVAMAFTRKSVWLNHGGYELKRFGNGPPLTMLLPDLKVTLGMTSIFEDKEGTVWLCNDGAGVFKLTNPGLSVTANPFAQQLKTAFAFGDTVWLNTYGNELVRTTGSLNTVFKSNVKPSPQVVGQIGHKLFAHDSRSMYEGILPSPGENLIQFKKMTTLPDTSGFGKAAIMDPFGNRITVTREGLVIWKGAQRIFSYDLLTSDYTEELRFDAQGRLWAATRYRGLIVFSLHPETPSAYLQVMWPFVKLPRGVSPRSMVIDKTGMVWIGTRSHGLLAYTVEQNAFKLKFSFGRSTGLTDDYVTTLACDKENNIIAGTQSGLDRLLHNNGRYSIENITRSSNLFSFVSYVWVNPNNSVTALSNRGELIQATAPSGEKPAEPFLFTEEIKMNGNTIGLDKKTFLHNENNLAIQIAAPSFIDEKAVRFSYRLEDGGASGWSDTSGNPVINLVNLSPGKYTLRVKAFFASTPYAAKEMSYAFEILPPWWQRWWFRVLIGVLLIGLFVFTLRYYYKRKLQKQRVVLERQQAIEKERTRIATDMHDDLGATLSRIKFLSEGIVLKKDHGMLIDDDVSRIKTYSHQMIDRMGEIVWALNEKNDSLADLLSYTRAYASEYLSEHGIQCKVETPVDVPALFVSGEFRRNIFLSVKEAMHNVVKHAAATEVELGFSVNKDLHITIKDNGKGLSSDTMPKGNGLLSMKSRMAAIHGRAEIKNEAGTIVRFSIPLHC